MPYPESPFSDAFNLSILHETGAGGESKQVRNLNLNSWLKWLCKCPNVSSYRVNTLITSVEQILTIIKHELLKISSERKLSPPNAYVHPLLNDVIIVEHYDVNELDLSRRNQEIIVDVHCGAAVLRGAHVFAPGVIGMTTGVKINEEVGIYADVKRKCKKGNKKVYEEENKVFLGNGIVKMQRHQLFGNDSEEGKEKAALEPNGIAVELIYPISGCPPLNEDALPKGSAMLQNIPSVVCVDVLNPQPGEAVLDMCAAPGNKTTHVGVKMRNNGILIAIDKTPTKIKWLRETCSLHGIKAHIFQADSTKICSRDNEANELIKGPPFPNECFDKILLDAPCSALGKRPQLLNSNSEKEIKSFVPLQRKLFENAVNLLKPGGVLVYSTCTITAAENEGLVAWALKTFNCIRLEKSDPYLSNPGWEVDGLTQEDLQCVQRFGPSDDVDSVGFFIAKFKKIKQL